VSGLSIAVIVLVGGGAAAAWAFGSGPATISGSMEQPGASGLPERIFFAIFGAPRDLEKEKQLSWRRRPAPTTQLPRTGFSGRGASRRW
jgi:hypothetical protein